MEQRKSEHQGFKKGKEKAWDRASLRKETLKIRKDFKSKVLRKAFRSKVLKNCKE
jgi:hypothetical protein